MLDFRQTNEPIYYGADQVQKTNNDQLRDVEERHGDLRQLETNIVQLHEIHRDFAELVSGHDQLIDNIESSVVQTETQVYTGVKALANTVALQSAARRKKILCSACVIIILILIAIIVTVVVITKNSK